MSVAVIAEIYSHMINGQGDDAARQWDDFQQKNSPEKKAGISLDSCTVLTS